MGLSLPTFKFQVSGSSSFGGTVVISSTTASTSTSSGALTVAGGVGIGGSTFIAPALTVGTGISGLLFRTQVGASNTGAIYSTAITPSSNNFTMITDGSSVILNGTYGVYLAISNLNKIAITSNNVNIGIAADSTSTSTGALTVNGGAGIGGSVNVGGRVGIGTNLLTAQINIQNPTATTPSILIQGATSQSEDYFKNFKLYRHYYIFYKFHW